MRKKRTSRLHLLLAIMLFASLWSGPAALAQETSGTAPNSTFSDVPSSHWAYKHVAKMALNGVISGTGGGKFAPNDNVTHEQAIVMAIRFMGLEDLAKSTVIADFPVGASDFAKPHINYAFQKGLLSFIEEQAQSGGDMKQWAKQEASREWIAKLTIKAIGQVPDDTGTTAFSDAADISAWAYGFVNAAANLNIVTGSDGKFMPTSKVTRAQIATFFSRAAAYLADQPEQIIVGTVKSMDGQTLTVTDANGQAIEVRLVPDTHYFSYKADGAISPSTIKEFYEVYIIQQGGTAYYVEITDDSMQVSETSGKLVSKDLQERTVTISTEGENLTYSLADPFSVTDTNGNGMEWDWLVPNSQVKLVYNTHTGKVLVTEIRVISLPVNKSAQGMIQQLDQANGEFDVLDSETASLESYPLAPELRLPGAEVKYGERIITVADIQAGDQIAYRVVNGVVTEIELLKPLHPLLETVEAVVDLNNLRSETLYVVLEDGTMTGYKLPKNTQVELDGKTNAKVDDIVAEDRVTLVLNEHHEIVKVTIRGRSIDMAYHVPFFIYDEVSNSLIARDQDQELVIYHLDEETKVYAWGGNEIKLDQIGSVIARDQKLDIVFSTGTNRLISAKVASTYEGSITHIDTANKKLTLLTEQNVTFTLDYNTFTLFERYDRSSSSITHFNVGDPVHVTLNSAQTALASVKLKYTSNYDIDSYTASTRTLKLKDSGGSEHSYFIGYDVVIKDYQKDNPTVADLVSGRSVSVKMVGRSVAQIDLLTVAFGNVISVDAQAGTFTMVDYNGNNQQRTYKLSGDAAVSVDDRLYVLIDSEGKQTITKMTALEKKFWRYDSTDRIVYFKISSPGEKGGFKLNEKAALKSAITTFKPEDVVLAYIYKDVILELVKR